MNRRLILWLFPVALHGCTNAPSPPPQPRPSAPVPSAISPPPPTASPAPAPAQREEDAIEGSGRCVLTAPPTQPLSALGPFTAIHGGESFCAQDAEGALWCGHANERDRLVRHPVSRPTRVSVSQGAYCAIDDGGTASCLLTLPEATASASPRRCILTLQDVRAIAVHRFDSHLTSGLPFNDYLCIASSDGRTRCHRSLFTYDATMPLGLTIDEPVVVESLPPADEIALPGSCGRSGGNVHCWSPPPEVTWAEPQHAPPPGPLHDVPTQTWTPRATPRPLAKPATSLQSGIEHVCTRDEAGAIRCWGRNEVRQLGFKMALPAPTREAAPALVDHPPRLVRGVAKATTIAVGAFHSCALTASPDRLVCWGLNDAEQLGHDHSDCHAAGHAPGLSNRCAGPTPVKGLALPTAISAQGAATLILDARGSLSWLPPQTP